MSFDTHWDVPWRTLHLGMIERSARDSLRGDARVTVSRIADADGWMVTMSMSSNRDATREFWMTVSTYAERMAADLNARVWSL